MFVISKPPEQHQWSSLKLTNCQTQLCQPKQAWTKQNFHSQLWLFSCMKPQPGWVIVSGRIYSPGLVRRLWVCQLHNRSLSVLYKIRISCKSSRAQIEAGYSCQNTTTTTTHLSLTAVTQVWQDAHKPHSWTQNRWRQKIEQRRHNTAV